MTEPLFDGENEVAKEEIFDRLDYYIELAEQGMEAYEKDKKEALNLAKEIRKELKKEYHNNDLVHISKYYRNHNFFYEYKRAIHEAFASITGSLSYQKLFSFLYDVSDYLYGCKLSIENKTLN